MGRFAVTLLLSATFLPALGSGQTAAQERSERLLGGNENPPVISEGSGSFTATTEGDAIAFELNYDVGSPENAVQAAHLHVANPGNNGPIVVFLCSNLGDTPPGATPRECPPSPGTVTGDIVAADVLPVSEGDPAVEIIAAGDLDGLKLLIDQSAVYVNVHTVDHPAGEIRGQMNPRRR
jgi:CHRD domain